MPYVIGTLAALTLIYQFGLDGLVTNMLSAPLGARVLVAWLLLFPLGFCLGMFMPLGLTYVGSFGTHGDEYIAWGWAVNGFFSVIGSVLTTILSMEFGFRSVQWLALAVYCVAALAFTRLRRIALARGHVGAVGDEVGTAAPEDAAVPQPAVT
jgi:hypothetical protein